MFLSADDVGVTEWAQGFARGVRILEAAWPMDLFVMTYAAHRGSLNVPALPAGMSTPVEDSAKGRRKRLPLGLVG